RVRQQPTVVDTAAPRGAETAVLIRSTGLKVRHECHMAAWLTTHSVFMAGIGSALLAAEEGGTGLGPFPLGRTGSGGCRHRGLQCSEQAGRTRHAQFLTSHLRAGSPPIRHRILATAMCGTDRAVVHRAAYQVHPRDGVSASR